MTANRRSSGHTQPYESFIRCNIRGFLHSYFVVKSLRLTRPGGLVVVVTSRWTMDSRNPAARREIATLADLLGAVRLPSGAFATAAGTDAVCDVLVLRRRDSAHSGVADERCGACQTGRCELCCDGGEWTCCCEAVHPAESWATITEMEVEGGAVTVNEWFARHPHMVLGDLRAGGGPYGAEDLTVVPSGRPLAADLASALGVVVRAARRSELTAAPAALQPALDPAPSPNTTSAALHKDAHHGEAHQKEGSIVATATGDFARVVAGQSEAFEPKPRSQRAELRALVEIRDALVATLWSQADSAEDTSYLFAQQRLNRAYDSYLARFGRLNRYRMIRTGRVDRATGEEIMRRADPPLGGFRADPDLPSVLALEMFDPDTQSARKAAIFTRRVIGPRARCLGADNAADALAICLDEIGGVDLARVADLLGVDTDTARAELGDLVWDDPTTAELVPAGRYLSGDVRAKLAAAETAAAADPRFEANVAALCAVLPPELGPAEIGARLGVTWVDVDDIAEFVRQVLGAETVVVEYAAATATWKLAVPSWQRRSVAMTSEWGTGRVDAVALVEWSLEQRPARVYDSLDDGRRVLNAEATLAAREKQEALEQRFSTWVWENPQRTERLVERYNRLFNSVVATVYDGSHQSLPGLAATFTPRPYQRNAVWRIVSEPNVLLGHAVGAGKTSTMVMAGMEMRRLGLVNKPAYVVPNHMLEQFSAELLQLYPQARVLVATRDATTPDARKHFVARCAMGEWDAVVITHSAFERIPVSVDSERAYIDGQIDELRQAIAASEAGSGLTVKRLEAAVARAEERQKRLLDARRDDGVVLRADRHRLPLRRLYCSPLRRSPRLWTA